MEPERFERKRGHGVLVTWKITDGDSKYLHNESGPAMEWPDGTTEWYQFDRLHRVGHPAIERANGTYVYAVNGLRHRVDGPASTYLSGCCWYAGGTELVTDTY